MINPSSSYQKLWKSGSYPFLSVETPVCSPVTETLNVQCKTKACLCATLKYVLIQFTGINSPLSQNDMLIIIFVSLPLKKQNLLILIAIINDKLATPQENFNLHLGKPQEMNVCVNAVYIVTLKIIMTNAELPHFKKISNDNNNILSFFFPTINNKY